MRKGILGGSFNPVHNAHVRLGVEALEQVGLDGVDLVPAPRPPHKTREAMLGFDFRCRLLELAVEHCQGFSVDRREEEREGPSYTLLTLQEYAEAHPDGEIYFIIGFDEFLMLPKWYEWRRLPEYANFAVGGRSGHSGGNITQFLRSYWPEVAVEEEEYAWRFPSGKRIVYLEMPRLDISSTMVRQRWSQGRNLSGLIPDRVLQALREAGVEHFAEE
jgi:nicotinate-nucleotide adenylyltransferase